MGAYLSAPVVEKDSTDESGERLSYGSSCMQGWRISQEDAHNCIIDFDTNTSFFAVYDGHGGAEVAKYCALNLPDYVRSVNAYKTGDISQGLEDAFLEFDSTLVKPEVVADLKKVAEIQDDDEDSDEDPLTLREEADMPIEELIARYKGGSVPLPPLVGGVLKKVVDYHNEKPKSPKLNAKKSNKTSNGSGENTSTSVNGVSSSEIKEDNIDSSTVDVGGAKVEVGGGKVEVGEGKVEAGGAKESKGEELEDGVSSTTINGKDETQAKNDNSQPGCSNVSSSSAKVAKPKQKKDTIEPLDGVALAQEELFSSESEEDEDFKGPNSSDSSGNEIEDEEEESEEDESDESSCEDGSGEIDTSQGEEVGQDSGCTSVVAVIRGNELFVANAGDSRCVVSRDGEAIEMSFDHKPEDELELKRITNAGGKVTSDGRVDGGLNLSRAIGDHSYKNNVDLNAKEQKITALPDIKTLTLDTDKDKFMVLACDGIWNSMSSQEVIDFVKERISKDIKLSKICEELFDNCMAPDTCGDGTGCDNMTAIIVKFHKLTTGVATNCVDSNKKRVAEEPNENLAKKSKTEC